jgi:hypothetical protein
MKNNMKNNEINKGHTRKSSISDNIPGSKNSLSSKMLPPSNKINNSFANKAKIESKASNPSITTELNPDKQLFTTIRKVASEKKDALENFIKAISKNNVDKAFNETNKTTKTSEIKKLYANLQSELMNIIVPSLSSDEKDLLSSLLDTNQNNTSHVSALLDKVNMSTHDKSMNKILDKSNIGDSEYKGNTSVNNTSMMNNTQFFLNNPTQWSIKDYAKKMIKAINSQPELVKVISTHLGVNLKDIPPLLIFETANKLESTSELFQTILDIVAEDVKQPLMAAQDFINEYAKAIKELDRLNLHQQYNESKTLKGSGDYGEEKDIGWVNPHFGKYTLDAIKHILALRIRDLDDLQLQDVQILQGRFISPEDNNISNLLAQISNSTTQTTIVPLNLFNKHASGLVFTKTLDNEFQVTYLDSLNETIPLELKQLISDHFDSRVKVNFEQITVEPQKYANCGPEVIENFIYYFTAKRFSQEEAIKLHSQLIEDELLGKDSIDTFLSFGRTTSTFEQEDNVRYVEFSTEEQISPDLSYSDLSYSDLLGVTPNNE